MSKYDRAWEAAQASPPVVVTGLSIAGISLSDVVMLLTGLYTIWQLYVLAPKVWEQTGKYYNSIKEWLHGRK